MTLLDKMFGPAILRRCRSCGAVSLQRSRVWRRYARCRFCGGREI